MERRQTTIRLPDKLMEQLQKEADRKCTMLGLEINVQ